MHYDYAASKAFAESLGLGWSDADPTLAQADEAFAALKLTQEQVDGLVRLHLSHIKWLFTPTNYSEERRVALSRMFLIGA